MPQAHDPSSLADQLHNTVILKFRRVLEDSLRPHGISLPRKGVLGVLADGPARMSELAGELYVTPRTITELVDALERDGLVERKNDPTDRRARVVSLTDAGRQLDTIAKKARNDAIDSIFGTMPDDERAALAHALATLNTRLDEMSDAPDDH